MCLLISIICIKNLCHLHTWNGLFSPSRSDYYRIRINLSWLHLQPLTCKWDYERLQKCWQVMWLPLWATSNLERYISVWLKVIALKENWHDYHEKAMKTNYLNHICLKDSICVNNVSAKVKKLETPTSAMATFEFCFVCGSLIRSNWKLLIRLTHSNAPFHLF